jgi:uncharacterized membrane protein HdeD (DUF308 family)
LAHVTVIDADGMIAAHRPWFIFLGVALIIAGLLAIAFPFAGGLAVEVWVAVALIISGIAQVVHAFAARQWQGFLLGLLVGLLYLAGGIILWLDPIKGVVTLTVFLAVMILIDGILRCVMALRIRPAPGWGMLLVGGILGIVVAFMIWAQLPTSATWAIGLLLGVNLIFSGIAFIALARTAGHRDAPMQR